MQKLTSVLLVDDDPTTNLLNKHLLLRLGVTEQVLIAENGDQALTLLADVCLATSGNVCPPLVLLDINMPVMSGIDFLEAYQPLPPARGMIIVVLTTSLHPRDLLRLPGFAVAEVVTKPLTQEKVQELLHRHFHWKLPLS